MRMKTRGRTLAAALVVLGAFSGVAFAQGDAEEPAAADPPPVEVGSKRNQNLTGPQVQDAASGIRDFLETTRKSIRTALTQARKERDLVKRLCLEDKLNQIDKTLSSAKDRLAAVNASLDQDTPDLEQARHDLNVMEFLKEQGQGIAAEANQCIGQEQGTAGETEVTVDISDDIPDTDPSEFPEDPVVSPPPPVNSPTF